MAISRFESRKQAAKYDKVVHTGDHENPMSTLIKELSLKLDEVVDAANNIKSSTGNTSVTFGDIYQVTKSGKTAYFIDITFTTGATTKRTTLTLT